MPKKKKPEPVLVIRTCTADMKSYGGFTWPTEGPVTCVEANVAYRLDSDGRFVKAVA